MSEHETKEKTGLKEKLKYVINQAVGIGLETYKVYSSHDMGVFSGYTALYMLMAIVPVVALVVGVVHFLPEEATRGILELISNLLPDIPQIQSFTRDLIAQLNPQEGTVVVSVSIVSLIWSASKGVSALQLGLMRICDNEQNFVKRKLSSLLFTLLFILLIPSLLIFQVLRGVLQDIGNIISKTLQIPEIANIFERILSDGNLITAIAIGIIILLTYAYLDGLSRKIRVKIPGTIFTTVLWLLSSMVFEWFITGFWNASSLYGSLASIYLTAQWMKIILTILFLGASLNEVYYAYTTSELGELEDLSSLSNKLKNVVKKKDTKAAE